jgi:ferrous iron transport protein A
VKVIGFKLGINKAIRRKLLAFGIIPGTNVEVIRAAPLGDPIEIKLRGFLLSLRQTEYDQIIFEQQHCSSCKK